EYLATGRHEDLRRGRGGEAGFRHRERIRAVAHPRCPGAAERAWSTRRPPPRRHRVRPSFPAHARGLGARPQGGEEVGRGAKREGPAPMSRTVVKLPRAVDDLIACYAFFCERTTEAMADRFLDAVETTLERIAHSTGTGVPHATHNPRLAGPRSVRVKKFTRYFLFYRTFDDRIELVRVLHGARDVQSILDAEDEPVE